ncbi:SUN domain-containing ossification factor isoform X2 [Plutella xylostella]|uniref:SUN domain-containing ossification factor isoform X2 n=1 Tax=Plutella xylostella TaxID=51655 RepID=UPI0020325454|nr:SUN domain-containing ossification factor isoform X2 [Plutella xylostella]
MSPPRALLAALLLCQLVAYGGHQPLTKIFYTLPDTGQPPILISLADNAKLDLKQADELLFTNESEPHNDTTTFTLVEAPEDGDKPRTEDKETLVVRAKPMHETRLAEDAFQTTTAAPDTDTESQTTTEDEEDPEIPVKPQTPQEDIPSFSEWAQKQLAEAEKKDTVLNHSSQPSHSNTNFSSKSTKLRSKNYASPPCGAKIVAVNPEAGSASSILSQNKDEYMLNTCNSRIWFVVELCEPVQAQKIEIANFELFSSTPKDIAVYFSDRFPTREWTSVGQFRAADVRDVQSFDLFPHMFGKFIKVELLSHYGSEHYCPISLFKVYGTSEFEVLEKESSQHAAHTDDDDDDEIIDAPDIASAELDTSKNLFGSARDAVMSIMKKAAQVLVKTEVPKNVTSEHNDTNTDKMYKRCCTPSHIIVCDNCSEALYNEVFELISCSSDKLSNALRQVFLRETLQCTGVCLPYGLDFKSTKPIEFSEERVAYMNALFPPKYLAALCNLLAIKEKKVVLNSSFESELNVTANATTNDTTQKVSEEIGVDQDAKIVLPNENTSAEDDKTVETVDEDYKPLAPEVSTENAIQEDETLKPDDGTEEVAPTEEKTDKLETEDKQPTPEPERPDIQKQDIETKDSTKQEVKKPDQPEKKDPNIGEEPSELMMESEGYLSELDQLAADPPPPAPGAPAPGAPAVNQQALQKESVFLRLSNRVKTLERNMSLSGQYLEELSRRYKKQVEEMQKSFEKTLLQMTEERRKSNEREQKYLEQMTNLQDQLAQVAAAMKILMEERDSWFGNITFFKFLFLQTVVVVAIIYYISKRRRVVPIALPIGRKVKKKDKEKLRRKSVEGVSGHATPSVKKRRPSEEALVIARQSTEEMDREEEVGEWQIARKNRKRKTSILHRNADCDSLNWARKDSIGKLQENTIPLDEEEFVAPVTEPKEFNVVALKASKVEIPKTNGSLFNSFKAKPKTRRLSSPAFLRTFSRQSTRSVPTPPIVEKTFFNGKAPSESPTSSLWSESTEISHSQPNGFDDSRVKKKKSLKNLFKKVF